MPEFSIVNHWIGLRGKNTGKPYVSWENRWFPVSCTFSQENQSIEPQRATPLTHQATEGVDGQTQHQ